MEVCEKCRKPIPTFDYSDRRVPCFTTDISVKVVIKKALCLDCVMESLRKIVSDYEDSGHQLRCYVPRTKFEYKEVATG